MRMRKLIERLEEEVKAGQYFVVVDVSVAGGKMIGGLHHGVNSADKEAAKHQKNGKNVQVIDAKWYGPASDLMKANGML